MPSMSLVAYKDQGCLGFSVFHLLFGVISGLFQPVITYYGLLQFVLL